MALAARDLKNDDTTDAGFDLILDGITSPVTGDVGVTRIDVGTGTTSVRMDSSNPLFSQLTAGTAEIGKLAAGTAEIGNIKNAGTFAVQIVDTSFAVADGNALGEGVLVQGDDGTDRKNINVDATTGDVQVDVTNTVTVAAHAVTNAGTFAVQSTLQAGTAEIGKLAAGVAEIGNVKNAGTFAVQIVDTSFAVADGNALGEGVLVQGDDGTDRKNINVDATTGDVQVDVTNTVTVGSHAVTNAGTFATQATLQAGTAEFGKLAAGSAEIGSVKWAGTSPPIGAGTEAAALRVTLATNSTGVVSIDDNGGTLTVDNAGLTELAAAINSSKLDIDIASSTVDVMLGTDFSTVLGTASLILGTQADDVANTSDGLQTSSFLYVYDGSTWDRLRGTSTDGMLVNLGSNNDVTVSGTVTVDGSGVTQPVSNAGLTELAAAINSSKMDINLDSTPAANLVTLAAAVSTEMQCDIVAALPTGANAIGKLALNAGVNIGDVDITNIAAQTAGGCDFFYHADLDETKREVKSTAGTLYGGQVINLKATPLYLQVFNLAAASVTVGSTTPDMQFVIPSQGTTNGAGFALPVPVCGIAMGTGITVACSTDSEGSSAPGANECVVNLFFK